MPKPKALVGLSLAHMQDKVGLSVNDMNKRFGKMLLFQFTYTVCHFI